MTSSSMDAQFLNCRSYWLLRSTQSNFQHDHEGGGVFVRKVHQLSNCNQYFSIGYGGMEGKEMRIKASTYCHTVYS